MDKDLTPTVISTDTGARAMRGSVFFPIFKGKWHKDVPRAYHKLRRLWHRVVNELKEAGWAALDGERARQYMRNCPPFGVTTRSTTMPCQRRLICPFCWARYYTASVYWKLVDALRLYPEGSVGVLATRRMIADGDVEEAGDEEEIFGEFRKIIATPARRARDVRPYQHHGACVFHHVGWRGPRLMLWQSVVLFLDKAQVDEVPVRKEGDADVLVDRCPTVNNGELGRLASKVCAYPAEYLEEGSAARVVAYLTALARVRMLSWYQGDGEGRNTLGDLAEAARRLRRVRCELEHLTGLKGLEALGTAVAALARRAAVLAEKVKEKQRKGKEHE
jgi:hypothetical protein